MENQKQKQLKDLIIEMTELFADEGISVNDITAALKTLFDAYAERYALDKNI